MNNFRVNKPRHLLLDSAKTEIAIVGRDENIYNSYPLNLVIHLNDLQYQLIKFLINCLNETVKFKLKLNYGLKSLHAVNKRGPITVRNYTFSSMH